MRGWWLGIVIGACQSTSQQPTAQGTATAHDTAPVTKRGRMVVTDTQVEIFDPIRFLAGSASIDARSTPVLDAIAATLTGNPKIKLVAVHAYGADALVQFQSRIGAERAQAIVEQLVARGVARSRLVAQGEATPPPGGSMGPSFEILARDP